MEYLDANIKDEFNFIRVLGSGTYADVHLAKKLQDPDKDKYFAVKDVSRKKMKKEFLKTEKHALIKLNHPLIAKLFYTIKNVDRFYFIMQYYPGGDLCNLIEKKRYLKEKQIQFYAYEIAEALEYIHSKNIIHRDIKSENILLDAHGHTKVADFGMSKLCYFIDQTTKTFCGTIIYNSPERINGQPYNYLADIWSYGILLFYLATGIYPFEEATDRKTMSNIVNQEFEPTEYLKNQKSFCDLLKSLLCKNPKMRIGASSGTKGILQHVWFKDCTNRMTPPFKLRAYKKKIRIKDNKYIPNCTRQDDFTKF